MKTLKVTRNPLNMYALLNFLYKIQNSSPNMYLWNNIFIEG